jgi:hypothetical protein
MVLASSALQHGPGVRAKPVIYGMAVAVEELSFRIREATGEDASAVRDISSATKYPTQG